MLRNPSKSMGPRNQSLLNEVLSLNAQEFGLRYAAFMFDTDILNEVLSLNAQEFYSCGTVSLWRVPQ